LIGAEALATYLLVERASHEHMMLTNRDPQPSSDPVIGWLLDADPSIRWQVMRDLTDTPAEIVAAERSRVASEGWGPRLLDQQRPDGQWGDGIATPFWWSNMYTLLFLRDLGLDPTRARANRDRSRSQPRHVGTRVRRFPLLRG
jgi:hypothetical protein